MAQRGLLAAAALLIAASSAPAADTGERHRVFFRDRWVSYLERDGLAIAEGDILLGHAPAIARLRDAPVPPKALVVDQAEQLWPADASGVRRVPYVFDAGQQASVDAAIAQFNATFPGSSSGCRARPKPTTLRSTWPVRPGVASRGSDAPAAGRS
jgi:hypothetical protein